MKLTTFEKLQNRLQELYAEGDFEGARDLAAEHADDFPVHRHLISYWLSTMSAKIGAYDDAISILRDALETGTWYGETLLRQSPSYQPIQGNPKFEELVAKNQELRERDMQLGLNILTVRPEGKCKFGDPPCKLLLGLHANMSTARDTIEFFQVAASFDWLVAAPQSSQAAWKDAYIWNELEISALEIEQNYVKLLQQYNIDQDQIVLAGLSMGGEIAMWLSLSGKIPNLGFIAYGPGGPFMEDLDKWQPFIEIASQSGLRGYIIIGEDDHTIPYENIPKLVDMLNANEIFCELDIIPNAKHAFTLEYQTVLIRALKYINPED